MLRSTLVLTLLLAGCGGSSPPASAAPISADTASTASSPAPSSSSTTTAADAATVAPPRSIQCNPSKGTGAVGLQRTGQGKLSGNATYEYWRTTYAGCTESEKEIVCDGAWTPATPPGQQAQPAQLKISRVAVDSSFPGSITMPDRNAMTWRCLFSANDAPGQASPSTSATAAPTGSAHK